MKAIIKKIELKKMMNKPYLKITMESKKKEYIVSNPFINDSINFRKQVFGMLSACNCYDLMKLSRKEPISQEATGYYFKGKGYRILESKDRKWFSFNEKKGIYSCQKADESTKNLIRMAQEQNISKVETHDGSIESIMSRSGVFSILFQSKYSGASCMTTGQIYWGFGKPINIGNNATESEKIASAKMFTSFIVSLLEFYDKDDLLKIGGDVEVYPEVEITLDHRNRVKSIQNINTGLGFCIGKSYEIIDSSWTYNDERLN